MMGCASNRRRPENPPLMGSPLENGPDVHPTICPDDEMCPYLEATRKPSVDGNIPHWDVVPTYIQPYILIMGCAPTQRRPRKPPLMGYPLLGGGSDISPFIRPDDGILFHSEAKVRLPRCWDVPHTVVMSTHSLMECAPT